MTCSNAELPRSSNILFQTRVSRPRNSLSQLFTYGAPTREDRDHVTKSKECLRETEVDDASTIRFVYLILKTNKCRYQCILMQERFQRTLQKYIPMTCSSPLMWSIRSKTSATCHVSIFTITINADISIERAKCAKMCFSSADHRINMSRLDVPA